LSDEELLRNNNLIHIHSHKHINVIHNHSHLHLEHELGIVSP